ncbi:uncharacterized protein PV09_04275 [Verruconis gallopava]|uniref:cAMP-dependent protein kinase n=1 Tax=Verruconis gallopava TaxID=253628 RepID=A0A0D2ADK4_9PEZI|nr:uncharacterized protein PV09_04275 [Verruconis gallopava]KIW04520.1 hypothetical protein PV09_04275 [Verruconis gallopava]
MAAAAINTLRELPHKLRKASSEEVSGARRESHHSPKPPHESRHERKEHEQERNQILQWEAEKHTLRPEEIVRRGDEKHVGFSSRRLRCDDFELRKTLGTGTFARVWLVTLRADTNTTNPKVFALKILRKADVVRLKQVEHVRNERNILAAVAGHPFITCLVTSFQDHDSLYMLLDYCPGGEVFSYLRRARRFNEETSRFYASEIVLILEFLHERMGVAYRDLKPENMLIDAEGHLKLVDFGFAKKIGKLETYTLCGTPEYLAPEVIRNTGHGYAVDWWALGILIYEFLVGQPPFWDQNPIKIYEQIVEGKIRFPSAMPDAARDIISRLCTVDVTKRLGNIKGGARTVKQHEWFAGVNWDDMYYRRCRGPIIPHLSSPTDTRNFDEYEPESEDREKFTDEMNKKYEEFFADF